MYGRLCDIIKSSAHKIYGQHMYCQTPGCRSYRLAVEASRFWKIARNCVHKRTNRNFYRYISRKPPYSSVVGQKLALLIVFNGLWVLALNCLSGINSSHLMSLKQLIGMVVLAIMMCGVCNDYFLMIPI